MSRNGSRFAGEVCSWVEVTTCDHRRRKQQCGRSEICFSGAGNCHKFSSNEVTEIERNFKVIFPLDGELLRDLTPGSALDHE